MSVNVRLFPPLSSLNTTNKCATDTMTETERERQRHKDEEKEIRVEKARSNPMLVPMGGANKVNEKAE